MGGSSGYAAINGSRMGLTSAWAGELARLGIRSHGIIVSEGTTPLHGRKVAPKEVAETIAFLLSPRASGMPGEFVYVDGGYVHLDRGI